MVEVHDFAAAVVRRAQEEGGIPSDRDPEAEAWIFMSLGLLSMADRSLDGLVEDRWLGIIGSRRRWLAGRDLSPEERTSWKGIAGRRKGR
jgi:hypothetical protein